MPKPSGVIPQMLALSSTPLTNPPAGNLYLYFKSDGKLYQKNSAGAESQVDTSGGAPSNMVTTDTTQTISGTKTFTGGVTFPPTVTFSNPGVGVESKFNFVKTSDGAYISVLEAASDQTLYRFGMWDNPDTTVDAFQWHMAAWEGASLGWTPLHIAGLTTRFAGFTSHWGPLSLPTSIPFYTTGNTSDSGAPTTWINASAPSTSTTANIAKQSGTGTGTFNINPAGFTSTNAVMYTIEIDGAGTFKWGNGNGSTSVATGVVITGGWQTLNNGAQIQLSTTGHVVGDKWAFRVWPGPMVALNDAPVRFRSRTDANHQLLYASGVDGPRLHGNLGGELGYTNGGSFIQRLLWNSGGVTLTGKLTSSYAATLGGNAADYVEVESRTHSGQVNNFKRLLWMQRRAAGTDWQTAQLYDGIGIDTSFATPTTAKNYWRRSPNEGLQAWGSAGTDHLILSATAATLAVPLTVDTINLTNALTQAKTHASPDTDSSHAALHHTLGTGPNQAAVGNHTHTVTNLALNPRAISPENAEYLSRWSWTHGWVTGAGDGPSALAGVTTYLRATSPGTEQTNAIGRGIDLYNNIDISPGTTGNAIKQPVTPGDTLTISAYVRSSVALTYFVAIAAFHNGAGAWVGSNTSGPDANLPANTWVRVSVTATVPAGATHLAVGLRTPGSFAYTYPPNSTMDFTGLLIEKSGTLGTWFDGDTTDTSTQAYAWTGTPNASTSTSSTVFAQANTHASPDTDASSTALHHTLGTGTNQAAAGDHTHAVGGDVTGTVANIQIAAGAVTDAEVASANKDGLAATASMRTLGSGSQQAAAGNHRHDMPDVQVFTASDIWAKPSGAVWVRVRMVGGGGAGGGAEATPAGESSAGAGGSSGAYAESVLSASSLAINVAVTRGNGGNGVSGAAGLDGGESSFGTHVVAPGGMGGGAMVAGSGANVNMHTAPSTDPITGQITSAGQPGEGTIRVAATQVRGGNGAPSVLGAGGRGICDTSSAGGAAGGPGGGGGGAANLASQSARAGGNGADGIVIVETYF